MGWLLRGERGRRGADEKVVESRCTGSGLQLRVKRFLFIVVVVVDVAGATEGIAVVGHRRLLRLLGGRLAHGDEKARGVLEAILEGRRWLLLLLLMMKMLLKLRIGDVLVERWVGAVTEGVLVRQRVLLPSDTLGGERGGEPPKGGVLRLDGDADGWGEGMDGVIGGTGLGPHEPEHLVWVDGGHGRWRAVLRVEARRLRRVHVVCHEQIFEIDVVQQIVFRRVVGCVVGTQSALDVENVFQGLHFDFHLKLHFIRVHDGRTRHIMGR